MIMESDGLISIPNDVAKLIPIDQLKMTRENPLAFQDGIELLVNQLQKCPNLYETDNMEEHPAIFHYFYGGTDFYICEYDRDNRMFGYVILNGDLQNSEWGYIALSELTKIPPLNIDYHFEKQTVEEALFSQYPKYFKKPKSIDKLSWKTQFKIGLKFSDFVSTQSLMKKEEWIEKCVSEGLTERETQYVIRCADRMDKIIPESD